MSPRARVLAYGSATLVVIAGAACAALVAGITGEVLTIVLISLGLGAVVTLIFYEIGLSEDRELAREEGRRRQRAKRKLRHDDAPRARAFGGRSGRPPGWPRRRG